ncbi:hypothetical protein MKEN_00986700 [Mycena kentingensis (nom. inval.)]|nr:hypothetical protein MKEN_00986700 [Mycena kentingensis (nom. inval.)]
MPINSNCPTHTALPYYHHLMPSLLDLPNELLCEITDYFPVFVAVPEADFLGITANEYDREDVLRALSRTCVRLRSVFLPLLWARVHAVFTQRRQRRKPRTREKAVETRLAALRRATDLHDYVRYLAVTMDECTPDNWHGMVELIRVLSVLPNLRRVVLSGMAQYAGSLLASSVAEKHFTSVTELYISHLSTNHVAILSAFPNVRELGVKDNNNGMNAVLVKAIADILPGLTVMKNVMLSGASAADVATLSAIRESFRSLQKITIKGRIVPETLHALAPLPALRELTIRYRTPQSWEKDVPTPEALTAAGREVLSRCGRGGTTHAQPERVLRMEYVGPRSWWDHGGPVDRVEVFVL